MVRIPGLRLALPVVFTMMVAGCGGGTTASTDAGGTYAWGIDAELSGQLSFYGRSTQYFRDLRAIELVALGQLPNSILGALRFGAHRRELAAATLDQLGLSRYADRPLTELSNAVQKLVDIARAVVAGTHLLLLDEPTSGVSGRERGMIADALGRLRELGRTILLIDHDPGFATANCDRLMAMNFGQVLHIGPPDEVLDHEVVKRSYLGH
jgi:ABC-type branched-subunit amino acid transport system ATPase component